MIPLPPWAQTVAAIVVPLITAILLVLVSLPRWGRVLRDRGRKLLDADPASEEGARLLARGNRFLRLGSDLRALRDSPMGQRIPAPMRLILDSLPESDPPPASTTVEVQTVTVTRTDAERTPVGPRRIPPLPLLLLCLALAGCTRAEQVQAANAQRTTGHATARTLGELCDYEAADAMPADDARVHTFNLDQRGCDVAWQAQTAFARAHAAQVAAIEAAERGECMIGTPRERPACDLIGVASKTYAAGRALADSVAAVRAAAEAMRAK